MLLSELIEKLEQDRLNLGGEWRRLEDDDHPDNLFILAKDRRMGCEIAVLKDDLRRLGDHEVGDLALASGANEG